MNIVTLFFIPSAQMEMRRNYEQELPVFMDMMEKLLISNNDGNDFFVGDEVGCSSFFSSKIAEISGEISSTSWILFQVIN